MAHEGCSLVLRINQNEQIHNKALDLRRRMARIFIYGANNYLPKMNIFLKEK